MKPKVTSATRNPLAMKLVQPLTREFELTVRPIQHPSLSILSHKHEKEFHSAIPLIQTNPEEAIKILTALEQRYPAVLPVLNNLISALLSAGQDEEAEIRIVELYREYPDYIFAKIMYGEYCLLHDKLEEIPKVFRNLWDPKLLYPERNVFHVSEVTSFVGFVGLYFFAIGDMKLAQEYYEYLYKLAPTNPQTLRMKNVLFPEIEGYIQ